MEGASSNMSGNSHAIRKFTVSLSFPTCRNLCRIVNIPNCLGLLDTNGENRECSIFLKVPSFL